MQYLWSAIKLGKPVLKKKKQKTQSSLFIAIWYCTHQSLVFE